MAPSKLLYRLTGLVYLILVALPLHADDLASVYQKALAADPAFNAALAEHTAALEALPQSRAGLLPDITLSGAVSRDRFDPRNGGATSYATNETYTIGLRQPVYRRDRFIQLQQADSRIAQADAQFAAARQDLALRVATRYFLVLGALDNLAFVRADKAALTRTLDQATQRFEVGLAAITDTLKAQAAYDIAISDEISAEQQLADAHEALRELTGELPSTLEVLKADIPLLVPDPADQDQWVAAAIEQNPLMLAAQAATETAKQEIRVQRSGHYPSIDVTADYSYRDNRFGGFQDLERNDSAIGVEMSLPLYQGGLTASRTREQRSLYNQAQEQQEQQYRATERQTRDNYRGVVSGISKVNALKRAIESNEKAYEAARAGFDVGTRDIVDVLDAQRELLRARRDHARSRYDYLLDTLRLKQAAGIIEESDLAEINAWLVEGEIK
ncbi:MAG: TolC family outer membrane protein [Gammaproteobacteria bacterium]|nr:TolC family outer membrane protein [Gammaproteobacteria bacterium]